jgi:hypothetical protein
MTATPRPLSGPMSHTPSAREVALAAAKNSLGPEELARQELNFQIQQGRRDRAMSLLRQADVTEWLPDITWGIVAYHDVAEPWWVVVTDSMEPSMWHLLVAREPDSMMRPKLVVRYVKQVEGSRYGWDGPVVRSLRDLGSLMAEDPRLN